MHEVKTFRSSIYKYKRKICNNDGIENRESYKFQYGVRRVNARANSPPSGKADHHHHHNHHYHHRHYRHHRHRYHHRYRHHPCLALNFPFISVVGSISRIIRVTKLLVIISSPPLPASSLAFRVQVA